MKVSKLQVIAIAMAIMITTGVVAGISSASQANYDQNSPQFDQQKFAKFKENHPQWAEKKQQFNDNHEAIVKALENNDYQAWLEIVGADSKIGQAVTEDEFPSLIEAHNLMREAKEKMLQAKEIKENIGFPAFKKGPQGMRKGL